MTKRRNLNSVLQAQGLINLGTRKPRNRKEIANKNGFRKAKHKALRVDY